MLMRVKTSNRLWLPPQFLIILLFVGVLNAGTVSSDVSGKWTGVLHMVAPDIGTWDETAVMILKQHGDDVTGTIGESEEQRLPLKNGRMSGVVLTIEMETNPVAFRLMVEGNKLTGDILDARDHTTILGHAELTRK
jgi:hypothetical protein